jgi:hypothetical protein
MNQHLDRHFPRYTQFAPAVPVWHVTPDSPRTIHRFFDTSPFSPSGRWLGLTRLASEDRLPRPGDVAEVVLVDLQTGRQRVVAETRGWDTQLGAQVQWGAADTELYFNDVDAGRWRPFGVRMNPLTGERRELAGTVYMVSPDGRRAVSACLRRTARTQAGYGVIVPPEHVPANRGAHDDDGTVPIRWIDLAAGTERQLVRIRTRPEWAGPKGELRVDPHPAWDRSWRYVAFNACPGGTRGVFVADVSALLD